MARPNKDQAARVSLRRDPLDQGDELHVSCPDALQESIHTQRVMGIPAVHHRQDVEIQVMLFEKTQAAHNAVEGGSDAFVHTIEVVEFRRTVNEIPFRK